MLLTLFSFGFLLRNQSLFIAGEGGSRLRNLFGRILWFSGEIEGGSAVVNRVQKKGCTKNWLPINCHWRGEGVEPGGGGRGSFCRDSTKILRPSPPAINSDWFIIKTSVNQNCILPPGLVTLLITKRKEYNAWYGPLPTSDRVIGKPWWKSLKDL